MRFIFAVLLFLQGWLFAVQPDFDVAVVGTSPISMLESIYHLSKGEKVLILEMDERCGGAWKSIDICGLRNVDLGCHLIGKDRRIKDFFQQYFGCEFVCMEHPLKRADDAHSDCGNGYYFSKGCHELISTLENRLHSFENAVLLHQKLDSIYVDADRETVELFVGSQHWTAGKLIISGASHFQVRNPIFTNEERRKKVFPHYYFLIEDEVPSQFTYLTGIVAGMSRAMNLTPFIDFAEKNLQLVAVQVHANHEWEGPEKHFKALVEKKYLSPHAKVLKTETYYYSQGNINTSALTRLGGRMIEFLETTSFSSMNKHLDKWKSAMVPL